MIRRGFMWLFMMNKRLYRQAGFLLILLLIIVLSALLTLLDHRDGNLLRVAVCTDAADQSVYQDLLSGENTMMEMHFFTDEADAAAAVEEQGFDAAWLFSENPVNAAARYVSEGEPMVEILQREDTVFLRLSREKLFATLYPFLSRSIYRDFMEDTFGKAEGDLYGSLYESETVQRQIVRLLYTDNSSAEVPLSDTTAPLRGLLAIAVYICAHSALMGFQKDRRAGLFSRLPPGRMPLVAFLCILLPTANAALAVLIAYGICGVFTGAVTELLLMLLYVLLCTAFCLLLGEICDRLSVLGALLPVLAMLMLALCPVFLHTDLPTLQLLLPPFYYLSGLYRGVYAVGGAGYLALLIALYAALRFLQEKALHRFR